MSVSLGGRWKEAQGTRGGVASLEMVELGNGNFATSLNEIPKLWK